MLSISNKSSSKAGNFPVSPIALHFHTHLNRFCIGIELKLIKFVFSKSEKSHNILIKIVDSKLSLRDNTCNLLKTVKTVFIHKR